jgi:transposase-like protein
MTISKKKFTKEFKLETLRLASQSNTCIAQLARDLDIRRNMIYKWRGQLNKKQDKAFKVDNKPYFFAILTVQFLSPSGACLLTLFLILSNSF